MKRQIIVILCLAMGLTLSACGGTNAEQTLSDNIIEEDSTENEVETEEETPEEIEQEEDESEENEITDSTPPVDENGIPTTNEGLTVEEVTRADGAYLESLGYYNPDDWIDYAHSQGADGTDGAWWIYNYGGEYSGNTGRSYAVNQRTGIRIEAGPDSYLYGGPDTNDSEPFFGSGNTFPGEEYSEWETNLRKHIGIDD